jgi:hypothetical protein
VVTLPRRRFLQIVAASSGLAITGTDLLSQAVANASSTIHANGSRGIRPPGHRADLPWIYRVHAALGSRLRLERGRRPVRIRVPSGILC